MKAAIVIGDRIRVTEEAVDLLREAPDRVLAVEDIFDDGGVTVMALVDDSQRRVR